MALLDRDRMLESADLQQAETKLLTIAIPTYNRAPYLDLSLSQLVKQLDGHEPEIELLVSNNSSTDDTDKVIKAYMGRGCSINYLKNAENIGSDRNIAQCFDRARGRYVLILGDDDVLVDGAVVKIVEALRSGNYGVVLLQPYGYDYNYVEEKPIRLWKRTIVFDDKSRFICKLGIFSTFISSNIINKSLLKDLTAISYVGTSLVQTFLVYEAVLASHRNLYMSEYLVACKRNNSGDYHFFDVFVRQINEIFTQFTEKGIPRSTFRRVNNYMLCAFFPYYILKFRFTDDEKNMNPAIYAKLISYYRSYLLFWVCIVPLVKLPKLLAMAWGVAVIVISRVLNGEFARVMFFAWNKIRFTLKVQL